MRVAIYARYSSENQRDASIADQLRVCREFAQRHDWTIAQEYCEHSNRRDVHSPGFRARHLMRYQGREWLNDIRDT
jgi:DNA invertase Pin-like site-specific DNA recombinase